VTRQPVNPWDWGLQWSMNQGELVEGLKRYLHCSGQVAVRPDPSSEMGHAPGGPNSDLIPGPSAPQSTLARYARIVARSTLAPL
jgi:hypothetical protein